MSKKKIQQKTIQQGARNQSQGKRLWTEKEVCAVERHLLGYILRAQIPGATQIKECMSKEPALASRSWTNIKDYCRNRITALARKK